MERLKAADFKLIDQLNLTVIGHPSKTDMLVSQMNIPTRLIPCLTSKGIFTVGDLCQYTLARLMSIRGIGVLGATQIFNELAKHELSLKLDETRTVKKKVARHVQSYIYK